MVKTKKEIVNDTVNDDNVFSCSFKDSPTKLANEIKQVAGDNPVFFCIGSDAVSFDSIGPKIGTRLKERANGSIIVYGVEGDAINALNIKKAYKAIRYVHPQSQIIAIDSAVGAGLGKISIKDDGIYPGLGVGKYLGKVGDKSITCVIGRPAYYEGACSVVLNKFIDLAADTIADAILLAAA